MTRRRLLLFSALLLFLVSVFLFKDHWNEYRKIKKYELSRSSCSGLLRYLSHPNPHIRFSAFRALYRIGSETASESYWDAALAEPESEVRREALFGLRYFPSLHSRIRTLLFQDAPPEEKTLLADSYFFNTAEEEEVSFLISLLDHPEYSSETLFIALGNLGRRGDYSPALTSLVRKSLLEHLSDNTSQALAYALSQWKVPVEKENRILQLVTGRHDWKEYYYISLLFSEKVLMSLLDTFDTYPPQLRIRYLQQAAPHRALRDLLYPRCRSSLERLPLVEAEDRPALLIKFLAPSFTPLIREAAAGRLLSLHALSEETVREYLHDPHFVRALSDHIPSALSLCPLPVLFSLTSSDDEYVRRNAVSSLAGLFPDKRRELALQAIKDPDFTVRLTGYDLLSENKPLFRETLLKHYPGEPNPELRIFLAELLQASGDSETLNILAGYEKDTAVTASFHTPSSPPFLKYDNDDYLIRFSTEKGDITIHCYGHEAPQTVDNIVTLVKKGFYNGIAFHRVALNHVIQAGDPHGDGWGGSLPLIKAEYSPLTYHEAGIVGIADRGKDTGSSQFFITLTPRYHLNGRYTIFARVVEGMDVVENIEPGDRIISACVLTSQR